MPLFVQIFDHRVRCSHIVYGHTGQIADAQGCRAVRQQQAGDAQRRQRRGKALRVRTDEKEAAGPALGKDGLCAGQLVGTAVVVVDRRRIAARLQTGLQFVQQVRKQSVLRALYNEGQPLRHLLLQMLGIGVAGSRAAPQRPVFFGVRPR